MRTSSALFAFALAAAPAIGRAQHSAVAKRPATQLSATADARAQWLSVSGFLLQSAMDVPEDKYSYKPTPEVRSFAELFGHVAGAQSMFCAMALGEKPPAESAVAITTKAALIDALKRSNKDCDLAYAQNDASVAANVDVFGEQHSRLYALIMNATHDNEHYGNLVTYLRMNGMVPPSSKPSK